mgnify:CR=1 FL=1
MQGGVQYDYLLNEIDIDRFNKLKKMVSNLSREQKKELNKK